ncbi:MAG: NAD(P)-dependent alcohol dehydrogenase [Cyclobacteriaceae bacterium]|nr:NAD(P)-dependent alcohol dehydrogenase [Cyclobacteriaceae bacterium]
MKAILLTKYGPPEVLQLQVIEKPIPKDNEVLIKIHATNITKGDCELRSFTFPFWIWIPLRIVMGIFIPRKKILGGYLSGEIEQVGKDVKRFNIGDQVYGISGFTFGGYAEYLCLPDNPKANVLVPKPPDMSWEEAATVGLGGMEALHFLRMANLTNGQEILINGAGGSIGTYAVQLARFYGAVITCIDRKEKQDMLLSMGAKHVIDYLKEDFSKNGLKYDVIFDIVGNISIGKAVKSLKSKGVFLIANPKLSHIFQRLWVSKTKNKKVLLDFTKHKLDDMLYLSELFEKGVIKPKIDKLYPMERIVEAHHYVESGRKEGDVVLSVDVNRVIEEKVQQ